MDIPDDKRKSIFGEIKAAYNMVKILDKIGSFEPLIKNIKNNNYVNIPNYTNNNEQSNKHYDKNIKLFN